MLGRELTRQDEDESRRLEAAAAAPPGEYGSILHGDGGNDNLVVGDGDEDYYEEGDDGDDDEQSGSDGDYVYDDDGDSESEEDDDEEEVDDDEVSYLLTSSQRELREKRIRKRRRRKRREERGDDGDDASRSKLVKAVRRKAQKLAGRIRSVVVAIADVDNVWDSPEYTGGGGGGGHVRGGGGDAGETSASGSVSVGPSRYRRGTRPDSPSFDTGSRDTSGRSSAATIRSSRWWVRSSAVYDAITGGTAHGTRNRAVALFWLFVLACGYASERTTFKLLVDRVGPFRLFSAELIVGAHAVLLGTILVANVAWKKDYKVKPVGLPLADVGLMAVLDTIYLLVCVISGSHVPPVLTVILVQTTIPLTACFTQCAHPDGRCTGRRGASSSDEHDESYPNVGGDASTRAESQSHAAATSNIMSSVDYVPDVELPLPPPPVAGWGGLNRVHITGTGLMLLAILIGLTPAVLSLDEIVLANKDAIPDRTAYNTIVFCLASIPAAASQLFKEHTLTRFKQPVDRNQLNMTLSIFQLVFAIIVSPLAYGLQGMGDGPGWSTLYPSRDIGDNFSDGFKCFVGFLDDETAESGYPERALCNWAWLLVILHVFSIVLVGHAIDKLAGATKVMYRGVSMGIMIAVLLMFIYQIRDKWSEYGVLVDFLHFTSTVVLIIGAEIYHRVSLQDATFETVYPDLGSFYEDE